LKCIYFAIEKSRHFSAAEASKDRADRENHMEGHNQTSGADEGARDGRDQVSAHFDPLNIERLSKLGLPSLLYLVLIEGVGRKKS
jgi:hypothetical protein